MMSISRLAELDGLRTGTAGSRPLRLHDDHLWTVPLIAKAQGDGFIPRPCHLVMFNRHRAGVLDIARDPWFCRGEEKADRILADLNHHVFDGILQLEQ